MYSCVLNAPIDVIPHMSIFRQKYAPTVESGGFDWRSNIPPTATYLNPAVCESILCGAKNSFIVRQTLLPEWRISTLFYSPFAGSP